MSDNEKIHLVLDAILRYGGIDGERHKAWVLDQVVRILTDCKLKEESAEYKNWVKSACSGQDGPDTYTWDVGTAP